MPNPTLQNPDSERPAPAQSAPPSQAPSSATPGPVSVVPESDAVVVFEVAPHNQFHRNAMMSTAQAACWIVLAGFELQKIRKEVARPGKRSDLANAGAGGWEKWVEDNCEFGPRTAQKYMAVADGVKSKALKAAKDNVDEFLKLLSVPAPELNSDQQKTLLQSVHKLTDGATIQQLYLDFEICKKPQGSGAKGGHKPAADPNKPKPENPEQQAAIDIWTPILRDLRLEGLEEKSWAHLPDAMLAELKGLLIDINKLLPAK